MLFTFEDLAEEREEMPNVVMLDGRVVEVVDLEEYDNGVS